MGGLPEITAGYLVLGERPALIETGPSRVASVVAEGITKAGLDPRDLGWIVLTHIHLDHGGGAGDLVRTFPNATVVVHPFGARHLVDPERLLASSARVYGELMDTVYGGLTPVEASRIKAVEDGEVIDLGGRRLELIHAPGHARHHIGVFEPDAGALFSRDGGPEVDHIEAALRERFELEEGQQSGDPDSFRLLNTYHSNAAGLARWISQRQAASQD